MGFSVSPCQKSKVLLAGKLGGNCPLWGLPCTLWNPGIHTEQVRPGCSTREERKVTHRKLTREFIFSHHLCIKEKESLPTTPREGYRNTNKVASCNSSLERKTLRRTLRTLTLPLRPRGRRFPGLWGFQWWCHLHVNLRSTWGDKEEAESMNYSHPPQADIVPPRKGADTTAPRSSSLHHPLLASFWAPAAAFAETLPGTQASSVSETIVPQRQEETLSASVCESPRPRFTKATADL